MRAFLLAAGLGTRLRPLTDEVPKCLVPINGRPLLDIWMDLLARHGVDRVLINTHHLADRVTAAVERLQRRKPMEIETVHEPRLLGSAGTIAENAAFIPEAETFVIAYADNLTALDLGRMIAHHRRYRTSETLLTMGLFRTPAPTECGIAVLDTDHRVTAFEEKPALPSGDLANAGIYVADYRLLDRIRRIRQARPDGVLDLGFDVLPTLKGRMIGYIISEYICDIGTLSAYEQAQRDWAALPQP